MAALVTQQLVDAGTKPTFGAAAASDTAEVGDGTNTYAHYKNASGGAVTVTVKGQGTTDYGVAEPDNVITVAATTGEALIPLRKSYSDGTGRAVITTSAQTSVTVAIVRL